MVEVPRGETVRERVTNHLLREFNAGQRDPKLTAALTYVNWESSRTLGNTLEQISDLHRRIIRRVAESGGPGKRPGMLLAGEWAATGSAARRAAAA